MTTFSTRIITALAAPAVAAGILAGGVALGAAAPAAAATAMQKCVTTGVMNVTPNSVNPLTRPAQVNATQPPTSVYAPPTTCVGN